MSLRKFLNELDNAGELIKIDTEVDPKLEIAKILKEKDGQAVMFENVRDSGYRVVGGVCGSRDNFARAIGIKKRELLRHLAQSIQSPVEPEILKRGENAKCQEVVKREVNLYEIPVLTHTSKDLGPYITAGVFIASDPDYGLNASFHRVSPISENRMVARICQRDLYSYIKRAGGEVAVSICIGLHPSVSLAAAISTKPEINELAIANTLHPLTLVRCKTNDLCVPADSEFVLEGVITKERHIEGPFPDITETYDIVREEPVIEIRCITHRKTPIYQAVLPAFNEHKLLMGMPKEPTIYNEVNRVCRCRDVLLTPGGCSWLHGVLQIEKNSPDDGKKAIDAAFKGHKSMKHVVVVDEDIDIHKPSDVEWAIATRFQAEKDIVIKKEKGSSLDPSADSDMTTSKVGVDATVPWDKLKGKSEGKSRDNSREKFMRIRLG